MVDDRVLVHGLEVGTGQQVIVVQTPKLRVENVKLATEHLERIHVDGEHD